MGRGKEPNDTHRGPTCRKYDKNAKLMASFDLAQLSAWPDGGHCPVGNVVIWFGEDDIKDTLVPRLIAAGANMSRMHFVADVSDADGVRSFDINRSPLF